MKLKISDRYYLLRLCSFGQTCETLPGNVNGAPCEDAGRLLGFCSVSCCSVTAWISLPAGEIVDLDGVRGSNVGTEVERLTAAAGYSGIPKSW